MVMIKTIVWQVLSVSKVIFTTKKISESLELLFWLGSFFIKIARGLAPPNLNYYFSMADH